MEKEKLKNLMAKGYQNTKAHILVFDKEYEPIDLEGWDEYFTR